MGVVSGLMLGAGVLLVWLSCWDVPSARRRGASRSRDVLVQAGLPDVTPLRLTVVSASVGVAVAAMAAVLTRALPIAGAFGLMAAYAPWAIALGRARKRRNDLREVWPEVVDHLASGVRAGLALPEAVSQLATRGPVALRAEFADFARDYGASGRFSECLDDLKDRMADPVADRIVEALRLTREVGGTDLGRLLRTLSEFLRDDNRTRGELEARQSWTVAGARLAVAGPWVVLAFLATRPETAAAYSSVQGAAVLGAGGLSCLVAYRVMLRIGRLPDDVRVLR